MPYILVFMLHYWSVSFINKSCLYNQDEDNETPSPQSENLVRINLNNKSSDRRSLESAKKKIHENYYLSCSDENSPMSKDFINLDEIKSEETNKSTDNINSSSAANSLQKYSCASCLYKTRSKTYLLKHLVSHSNSARPFTGVTPSCDFPKDVVKHPKVSIFPCTICDFKSKYKLSKNSSHMLSHQEERQHPCSLCDFKGRNKNVLASHMLTHPEVRPFPCTICDYKARTKTNLKGHMIIHSDEYPYTCDHCDYKARHQLSLKKHIVLHNDEKPHGCTYCSFTTKHTSSLENHIMTHTGEKPFKCGECDYKARQRQHLTTHLKTQHGQIGFSKRKSKEML